MAKKGIMGFIENRTTPKKSGREGGTPKKKNSNGTTVGTQSGKRGLPTPPGNNRSPETQLDASSPASTTPTETSHGDESRSDINTSGHSDDRNRNSQQADNQQFVEFLNKMNKDFSQQLKEVKKDFSQQLNEANEKVARIDGLEKQLNEANEKVARIDGLAKQVSELTGDWDQLKEQVIPGLEKQVSELTVDRDELKEQVIPGLEKQVSDLSGDRDQMKEQVSELTMDMDQLKEQVTIIPSLEKQVSDLSEDWDQLNEQLARIPDLEKQVSELAGDMDQLNEQVASIPSLEKQVSDLSEDWDQLNEQLARIPDLEKQVSELAGDMDQLNEQVASIPILEKQVSDLTEDWDQSNEQVASIPGLEKQVSELTGGNVQLNEQASGLEKPVSELVVDFAALDEELVAAEQRLASQRRQIDDVNRDLADLHGRFFAFEQSNASMLGVNGCIPDLQQQVARLRQDFHDWGIAPIATGEFERIFEEVVLQNIGSKYELPMEFTSMCDLDSFLSDDDNMQKVLATENVDSLGFKLEDIELLTKTLKKVRDDRNTNCHDIVPSCPTDAKARIIKLICEFASSPEDAERLVDVMEILTQGAIVVSPRT